MRSQDTPRGLVLLVAALSRRSPISSMGVGQD